MSIHERLRLTCQSEAETSALDWRSLAGWVTQPQINEPIVGRYRSSDLESSSESGTAWAATRSLGSVKTAGLIVMPSRTLFL